MTSYPVPPPRSRRSAGGFLLLEVLVALLIFAFGVLGIVGLQAAMTKAQSGSKYRGDAAYLAQELIGNMWADLPSLPKYTTTDCVNHPRCNAIKVKIAAALPAGSLEITQDSPGLIEIRLTWTPPGEETRNYRTAAAVRS
ncbi:MAG: pilus assembly protein PilV [Ideonella sp.]|nr:pilus assembly protein PilV [Ideonella sp.]